MNHTPEPWVIGGQHVPHHPLAILHESGVRATCVAAICDQGVSDHNIAEMEANARLIAAAPDLLAALKKAEPWLGRLIADGGHLKCAAPADAERTLAWVSAAIATATGEQKGATK